MTDDRTKMEINGGGIYKIGNLNQLRLTWLKTEVLWGSMEDDSEHTCSFYSMTRVSLTLQDQLQDDRIVLLRSQPRFLTKHFSIGAEVDIHYLLVVNQIPYLTPLCSTDHFILLFMYLNPADRHFTGLSTYSIHSMFMKRKKSLCLTVVQRWRALRASSTMAGSTTAKRSCTSQLPRNLKRKEIHLRYN